MLSKSADETITILLVGEDNARRTEVRGLLEQLQEPPMRIIEVAPDEQGRPAQPEVAMVLLDDQEAAGVAYLQHCASRAPRPFLIALHQQWSAAQMREILRAGADELATLPPNPDEIELILLRYLERRSAIGNRAGKGRIYSVAGVAGGVGVSSISAGLALAMKYAFERSVAILDLDLQSGGIALCLHLEHGQTIVPLLERLDQLDSMKLEGALSKHPSGVYLLAAPKRIEDADLVSRAAVAAILDLMRELFEVVIVDCGRRVNQNTIAAWERSAEVLYVLDPSPGTAARVPRFSQMFARLKLRTLSPRLVVNRFDQAAGAAAREALSERAGASIFATIPCDSRLMQWLQLHNVDLWQAAPSSRIARALEDLARRFESPQTPLRNVRLVDRVMGAFSASG